MNNTGNSMTDLITLIIPVYNTKKYLDECVKSVISQTYTNLEILLIDDGSTDGTSQMCDTYLSIDERIKVYHKTNEGLGLTRNYGVERAHGKFISFLDSDDRISQDFIETLYRCTLENDADVCKGGFTRFKGNEAIKCTRYDKAIYRGNEVKNEFLPRLIGSAPNKHDSVEMSVWGVLYKAEIIKSNNILFPSEREIISEDIVFNIQYFQHANIGCLLDSTGYYYRVNDASLTRSYRLDRFEAYKRFYLYIENLITGYGYKKDVIQRLNRYFFICLRKSIQQEAYNPDITKVNENLKRICEDELVKRIIGDYPVGQLEIKPRFFLYLVRSRKIILLKIALRFGIL